MHLTALEPSTYVRTPWKNGGGVTIDIAGATRPEAAASDWDAMVWRFGWTTIERAGPFSDLAGFDRLQLVVAGRGLVLETPAGEIDVRRPFVPVRFRGEAGITSRLEDGPVEVVNLIGDRAIVEIDLQVLEPGSMRMLGEGTHVLYAPAEACELDGDEMPWAIARGHALRLDGASGVPVRGRLGRTVIGSVRAR